MSATLPSIQAFLDGCGLAYEVWPCRPELADTAVFCEHYGVSLANSANAILVRSKTGDTRYVVCVLLATDRLNTNHTVRKKMGARKVSFASAEETRELSVIMKINHEARRHEHGAWMSDIPASRITRLERAAVAATQIIATGRKMASIVIM